MILIWLFHIGVDLTKRQISQFSKHFLVMRDDMRLYESWWCSDRSIFLIWISILNYEQRVERLYILVYLNDSRSVFDVSHLVDSIFVSVTTNLWRIVRISRICCNKSYVRQHRNLEFSVGSIYMDLLFAPARTFHYRERRKCVDPIHACSITFMDSCTLENDKDPSWSLNHNWRLRVVSNINTLQMSVACFPIRVSNFSVTSIGLEW